jgi:hypothetical protein
MKGALIRVATVSVLAMLLAAPAPAAPTINWEAVLRAIGGALNSWRLSPFPRPTATRAPSPSRTPTLAPPTRTGSPTRTATITRTATRTATETRTASPTRTATRTRTATKTRPPTSTQTPRPTSTPIPTQGENGQIAFAVAEGLPPEQRLASAFLFFPYIVGNANQDTLIELINMTNQELELQCFYVRKSDCLEVGFFVRLTAQQPLSWLIDEGTSNPLTFTNVPPFNPATTNDFGELKCAVATDRPELSAHNALQGRAIVFDRFTGETVGYGGIGFQKLSPGPFSGVIDLDGFTYDACPDRLHFQVLTRQVGGPVSEMIVAPCAEDLLTQTPTESVVQLQIVNEFEQVFSSSFRFKCLSSLSFSSLSTLGRATLGTDTAHVVVRGVSTPLVGLVIDRFLGQNNTLHTTANEPFLEGARPSTVIFP